MDSTQLSLCMVVKNEERHLGRCLDSVRDLAREIVLVDTGSTDGTLEIAARHGARVTHFDFSRVDFAAARNHGLAQATAGWILVLDADEALDAASIPLVREFVARNDNAGYFFQRLNRRPAPEQATTDYVVRLFPNRPDYRYRGRVHETVDTSILAGGGRLLRSTIKIDHEFATDPETRRARNLRYIAILKEEIADDPTDFGRLDFLAAEYHQLGEMEKAAEVIERIAAVRPQDPQAHLHAGVYHMLFKIDRRRARADLMEALRLKPGYPEALSFLERLDQEEAADRMQA